MFKFRNVSGIWNFYLIFVHYTRKLVCWTLTACVELLAIQQSSDVDIKPAESQQQTSEDVKGTLIIAVVDCSSLA